ncbi:MAG: hypothetical protein V1492_01180 [Candidatus Micrarchaeota archaeon]
MKQSIIPVCDLKQKLRTHLNSRTFQKAFESMVKRTLNNGCEHEFEVRLFFENNRITIKNTAMGGGASPDTSESNFNVRDSYSTGDYLLSILSFHTHPNLIEAAFEIPSSDDVKAICNIGCIGIVVPINMRSKELHMVVFQAKNQLSYVPYESLMEEKLSEGEEAVLRIAAERSILRVLQLGKRSKPVLSADEIDRILDTFSFDTRSNPAMIFAPR